MVNVKTKKCEVCQVKIPTFAMEGEKARRCAECKQPEMINVKTKMCEVCQVKQPVFALDGEKTARRCSECKTPEMLDVKNKKCEICKMKQPRFAMQEEKIPRRCFDCKLPEMMNVMSLKCESCNMKRPTFAMKGENARRCVGCKQPEMVNVVTRMCEQCGVKQPTFAFENEVNARRCVDCKQQGMIDVKSKKCEVCHIKQPSFAMEGEKRRRCGDCKELGMVDVVNHKCEVCHIKRPIFALQGEMKGRRCADCKEKGMIDVEDQKCEKCKTKIPVFAVEGEVNARRCADCADADMIDIVNRKCQELGCRKQARCAQPGVLPEYCVEHKKDGMMKNPRKKCAGNDEEDCKSFATHGITEPTHCEEHALPDEYCLAERTCPKCGKLDILNKTGVCVNFCSLEEKDTIMKKHAKKHEEVIVRLLDTEIDLKNMVVEMWKDTAIDRGCTKSRPDILYHCGNHIVVVEVDEEQHKSYKSCGSSKQDRMATERRRMYEIATIFGLPIVFFRYNPDGYVDCRGKKGTVITSKRHTLLVKWVRRAIHDQAVQGIQVKYLFYDGFNDADGSYEEITDDMLM
jgi:hypothetical protein